MTVSDTHILLLPSYNTGPRLREVVVDAISRWRPVLVVIDGSTDGSELPLLELARTDPALSVLVMPRNSGKGAAVLAGAQSALERGFTHALVMDADGQHPANSIVEFMEASRRHPDSMVLGRPILPPNTPIERRYGRKLSVGLARLELLGPGLDDPLFGFRVYPLAQLLAALGQRRGGRRYDFDTEAAVRLAWAGVPPRNLWAPVQYFSRAEGGVSHFHYLRDNVTLVWMHARIMAELLLLRWPAMLRNRRRWRVAGAVLALLLACGPSARGAGVDPLVNSGHLLAPLAPEWRDLSEAFLHHPDTRADFTERRFFSFKKDPVELKGEVRVSVAWGLSLHYTAPEERTVILDSKGTLIRTPAGESSPVADPRAKGADDAMLHILQLDLPALGRDFELYGQRDGASWALALVPRTEALRRALDRITVKGEAATIRQIEIRRAARQAIEIVIEPPHPPAAFTEDELRRCFRYTQRHKS